MQNASVEGKLLSQNVERDFNKLREIIAEMTCQLHYSTIDNQTWFMTQQIIDLSFICEQAVMSILEKNYSFNKISFLSFQRRYFSKE